MALTDSDKKKLPIIGLLIAGVAGGAYYHFLYNPAEASVTTQQAVVKAVANTVQPLANTVPTQTIDISQMQNQRVESVDTSLSLHPVTPDIKTLDIMDAKGNVVRAILEPEPVPRGVKRNLDLSEMDREIIQLMRSNLLNKIKNENTQLKAAKTAITSQPVNPQPTNTNVVPNNITPSIGQGFAEFETVQPTLLTSGISDSKIEDAFARVVVSSIIVDKGTPNAWVRIDGQLLKAIEGLTVGDFRFEQVRPDAITITFIKGNVTRTIGHTGFTVAKVGD